MGYLNAPCARPRSLTFPEFQTAVGNLKIQYIYLTMNIDYQKAQKHLARRDAVIKRLIREKGPCSLRPDPDHFGVLVRSIISQQISTRAALAIGNRLIQALGKLHPRTIDAASDQTLRQAGLSANKASSLRDLAQKVLNKEVPLQKLSALPDDEVVARLVPVRGIGRWTAEMFLIFSLGRLDVLPVADLGLRVGVQKQYALKDPPDKSILTALAEPWRPFRTIATWFIWRSFGNVPQSE